MLCYVRLGYTMLCYVMLYVRRRGGAHEAGGALRTTSRARAEIIFHN